MRLTKISLLCTAVALSGCSWLQSIEIDPTRDWTANQLYSEARAAVSEGTWEVARDYYTKLEARYPFGSYAQQAQIDLAYVNYKDDDAAGAILQLDRFLRAYPNHPNSDYALYLKALATLNERDGWLAELTTQDLADRDAQAARDLADQCDRFEKKLYDLELTRNISIQMGPQIRLIQSNDTMMAEKIQTTIVNTIPLWKNQMVLALGIAHSNEAAQAQRQVNDITNALLKQNAEKLHMASVETAKEAERGIVDIETLKKTNAELIQTLDDVMKIQSEGREKRIAAEAEMAKMENDLKGKLLEIRGGV